MLSDSYRKYFTDKIHRIIETSPGMPRRDLRRKFRTAFLREVAPEFFDVVQDIDGNTDLGRLWQAVKRTYLYQQWLAEVADLTGWKQERIIEAQDREAVLFNGASTMKRPKLTKVQARAYSLIRDAGEDGMNLADLVEAKIRTHVLDALVEKGYAIENGTQMFTVEEWEKRKSPAPVLPA